MLHSKAEQLFSTKIKIGPTLCHPTMRQTWNYLGPTPVSQLLSSPIASSPSSSIDLFADGDDFSSATIDRNRNLFEQKQLAMVIRDKVDQINTLLTQALNIHLNLGQSFVVNTSSTFMSIETLSATSLSKREIRPMEGVSILLPSLTNLSLTSISLRVCSPHLSHPHPHPPFDLLS